MPSAPQLDIREEFARFFENPSREKLRNMLKNRTGEYDFIDFKQDWPKGSDLAKDILAFANSGNGCIVAGVAEGEDGSLAIKGMTRKKDKTDLKDSVEKFLPDNVEYDFHDFEYTESEYETLKGKAFQILFVRREPRCIPFLSLADGSDIKRNRVYIRRNASSTEANHADLQGLIDTRLSASMESNGIREFEEHLGQLSALCDYLPPAFEMLGFSGVLGGRGEFISFVMDMVEKKKRIISGLVGSVDE